MPDEQNDPLASALKHDFDVRTKRAEQLGMTYLEYEKWYQELAPIPRHREFVAVYGPSDDPYDDFAIYNHVTGEVHYDYAALGPSIWSQMFTRLKNFIANLKTKQ